MDAERWKRLDDILDAALEIPSDRRDAFLQAACAGDSSLIEEVRSLLTSDRRAGNFLQSSAMGVAARAVAATEKPGPPELFAGQVMANYRLLKVIGSGGMGSVWLAERSDGRFDRKVAIKFINLTATGPGSVERFKREGNFLARLSHPHIAELIDAGITENQAPYLVLEYVEGKPIHEYCDEHVLSIDARIQLFLDVLDAVSHAHSSLIVHRDLKPSNVFVSTNGEIKLLDFGIAKLLSDEVDTGAATLLTIEGGGALTPRFAAPEQITGGRITTSTDVYALGALLYLLLTGQHPVGAGALSSAELIRAIVTTEPSRASDTVLSPNGAVIATKRGTTPEKLRRQMRGDLDTILGKAVKKAPHERYGSVVALADDLQRYLSHKPINARPDSFFYSANKFTRRHKVGVALTALAVIGILAGIIAVQRQARRAEYRFQQVRKLAHSVLFDLNPQIEDLAGATPAREQLVRTSLEYLDSLAAESSNDRGLQLELATAYEKIGDVQGNSRYSNLGHPEAAVESYRKALAIARKAPTSLQVLEVLAGAYTKIGTVQATQLSARVEGRENLLEGTKIADSIPRVTGNPDYQLRVEAYGMLGDIDELDEPALASSPIGRAMEIAREWTHADPSPQAKIYLAVLTRDWADIQWGTGDLNAALNTLSDSLAIFKEASLADPNNAEWRDQELVVWERLGLVNGHPDYFNLGDRRAAATWLSKNLDESEQSLAADPKNVRAQFQLSETLGELAAIYRDSDPSRSEKLYERSLALSTSALTTDPKDFDMLYWQSFERVGLASLLASTRKTPSAIDQLQKAIAVLQDLSDRDSSEILAHQLLGVALQRRASQSAQLGNTAAADQDVQRATGILEKLHTDHPTNLTILRDLADCYREKGNLAARRSNWREARTEYEKNLTLWQRWLQIGKTSTYDQRRREIAAGLVISANKHLN